MHTADPPVNPYPLIAAIPLPEGYSRVDAVPGSFAAWLRNIRLKKDKTVFLFDGTPKANQEAQFAVLDIPVGHKDLQQCADALMRLRAEYFYALKQFDKIAFRDNDHISYALGPQTDRKHFDAYLEKVFWQCGTLSLEKQLDRVADFARIRIGDVLIRGGSPGHAMLVADLAVNKEGKRAYLLVQGYMPAQDIHVVINPMNKGLSPWYEVNNREIDTPGWVFGPGQLRRWPNQ